MTLTEALEIALVQIEEGIMSYKETGYTTEHMEKAYRVIEEELRELRNDL